MKRTKITAFLCTITMVFAMVASACGTATEETETTAELESTEAAENQTGSSEEAELLMGKITAVDGNTITLALAEQPSGQGNKPDGEAPKMDENSTEQPPQMDENSTEQPPQMDGNSTEQPPQMDENSTEQPQMGTDMELTLTGETMEITVTDNTTITIDGEEKSISDLAVDDVINVEMNGDTVVSISSGMIGGKGEKK